MGGRCASVFILVSSCTCILATEKCDIGGRSFMENLDLKKSLGRYYLIYQVRSAPDLRRGSVLDIYVKEDKLHFDVKNVTTEGRCENPLTLTAQRTHDSSHFNLYITGKKIGETWVVATEYSTYGILYYCRSIHDGYCYEPRGLIFSRNKSMSPEAFKEAKDALNTLCLPDKKYFYPEGNYKNCPASAGVVISGSVGLLSVVLCATYRTHDQLN